MHFSELKKKFFTGNIFSDNCKGCLKEWQTKYPSKHLPVQSK